MTGRLQFDAAIAAIGAHEGLATGPVFADSGIAVTRWRVPRLDLVRSGSPAPAARDSLSAPAPAGRFVLQVCGPAARPPGTLREWQAWQNWLAAIVTWRSAWPASTSERDLVALWVNPAGDVAGVVRQGAAWSALHSLHLPGSGKAAMPLSPFASVGEDRAALALALADGRFSRLAGALGGLPTAALQQTTFAIAGLDAAGCALAHALVRNAAAGVVVLDPRPVEPACLQSELFLPEHVGLSRAQAAVRSVSDTDAADSDPSRARHAAYLGLRMLEGLFQGLASDSLHRRITQDDAGRLQAVDTAVPANPDCALCAALAGRGAAALADAARLDGADQSSVSPYMHNAR